MSADSVTASGGPLDNAKQYDAALQFSSWDMGPWADRADTGDKSSGHGVGRAAAAAAAS